MSWSLVEIAVPESANQVDGVDRRHMGIVSKILDLLQKTTHRCYILIRQPGLGVVSD